MLLHKKRKSLNDLRSIFEDFLTDLDNILLTDQKNINQDVLNLRSIFKSTLDKHAPTHTMSRKEKRLSEKDYSRHLDFDKNKNRLFKNYFKIDNSDSFKKEQ